MPHGRRFGWIAALLLIAVGAATHAWLAARTKAPTYDEPVHTLSSWLIVNASDFRLNPEHPPLWKYVAGVGLIGWPLEADRSSPPAEALLHDLQQEWPWTIGTLFPRGSDAGLAMIARARLAMTIFLAVLVLVVGRWAWAWGGPVAAILAGLLISFDPNFIGHGGLVTNDVAASCFIALATYLTWRLGERFDLRIAALLMLTVVAAIATKFSCLLLAPMLGIPLAYRACAGWPWQIAGRPDRAITSRQTRIALVTTIGGVAAIAVLVGIWPFYQFHESPVPNGERFDLSTAPSLSFNVVMADFEARVRANPSTPPLAVSELQLRMDAYRPGIATQFFDWLAQTSLVPQAYTYGINAANALSVRRWTFLLGEGSNLGRSIYFPVAIAVKTPMATMVILAAAGVASAAALRRRHLMRSIDASLRWKIVCAIVPPTIYLIAAMNARLNIGVRHVLPLYAPAFVVAGVALARLTHGWRPARYAIPAAIALLALETTSVFPNYISFFNRAAGGTRGGLSLLSDSNLDWGQDLKPLAAWYRAWRSEHPTTPFYLDYFGTTDPRAFGIDYINTAPGFPANPDLATTQIDHGVLAVSATYLQGMVSTNVVPAIRQLRAASPIATINDTIYIYQIDHLSLTPPPVPETTTQHSAAADATTRPTP